MPRAEVVIKTRDGNCPASIITPPNISGSWPAVIFYMDGPGIRPTLWQMGQLLADGGYLVLMPDLFYRDGSYPPRVPARLLADPGQRAEMMKSINSLNRERKISDTAAFIEFLQSRPDVEGDKYGAVGYCMGGNYALTAAGAFPDRFAAVASFHGGNLASQDPDSPHRFLGKFTGRVYVGGAVEDAHFPEEQKLRLEQALTEAGVSHVVETYVGAHHGFAVPDIPAFNQPAADRHWAALFDLFDQTLTPQGE